MQNANVTISPDPVMFSLMIMDEKNVYASLQRVIEVAMFFQTVSLNYP